MVSAAVPVPTLKAADAPLRVWMYDPWCVTPWYTAALTRALLDAAGCSVRLVAPRYHYEPHFFSEAALRTEPGPLDWTTRRSVPSAALRQALRFAEYAANTAALVAALQRERPAILHFQLCPLLGRRIPSDLWLLRAAQRQGVRSVHTVHNLLPHGAGRQSLALHQRFYQACDRLICHSPEIADALQQQFRISRQKIDVIPHGPLFAERPAGGTAAARAALSLPADRLIFLQQGVLSTYKGADLLLEAWAAMLERLPPGMARPLLVIAGRGPAALEAELLQAIQAQRLEDTVRAEFRYIASRDIPNYFEAADILCFPYREITTSGALLTGMSYNKPALASDLPAFNSLLRSGENALLAAPGDHRTLATAIETLVLDTELRRRLLLGAARNRQSIMQWDNIATMTARCYRHCLSTAR